MMHSSTIAGSMPARANGLADDQRAELGRGEVLQRAEEPAGGEARGRQDDGVSCSSLIGTRLRTATSIRVTTPSPSTKSRRERMSAVDRAISCRHCSLFTDHRQRGPAQLDAGGAIDRGADRRAPRERRPSPA